MKTQGLLCDNGSTECSSAIQLWESYLLMWKLFQIKLKLQETYRKNSYGLLFVIVIFIAMQV